MNPLVAAIELFSRHRNAANLLFISMIMFGFFGLSQLNRQFFPTVDVKNVSIRINWPGATAQDVDKNIVAAIQPEIRFLDGVKEVSSESRQNFAAITVEFEQEADMQRAVADIEAAVSALTTLPKQAERPIIKQEVFFEPIASLLISGPYDEAVLRVYAKNLRDGLLDVGIDKIEFEAFREPEIWIATRPEQLRRYNLTPQLIAAQIEASSLDVPSGILRGAVEQQVRAVGLAMTAEEVGNIDLRSLPDGRVLKIHDVAAVRETFAAAQANGYYRGNPAIRLTVLRSKNSDSLAATAKIRDYLAATRPTLPPNLEVTLFNVNANKILQRINVLLYNGLTGMALVLGILFLFLNGRIAFWVAMGIPASMMATFGVMWMLGMTINMLSMFALIMTIGIIVDDAIVVGEHAATLSEQGKNAQQAAEGGAIRMTMPIIAAALTTLAAFLSVLMVDGTFGQIIQPIPLVLLSVLVASLIECFLVLPGHLNSALSAPPKAAPKFKQNFQQAFNKFRDGRFRRFVTLAYDYRYTTIAAGIGILLVCIGLLSSGRVPFRFFPAPEGEVANAYVFFQPGTPRAQTKAGAEKVVAALYQAERELGGAEGDAVELVFTQIGRSRTTNGDERAYIWAELAPSEARTIRTGAIVKKWQSLMPELPGLRYIFVRELRGGPRGRDIDIRLSHDDPEVLKKAALEVRAALEKYPGISRARDNLHYNKEELLLEVNERGAARGFSNNFVGQATRGALEGLIAKRFAREDEEVTIRVLLPRDATAPALLEELELMIPNSTPPRFVPLTAVVDVVTAPGFSTIRRIDGKVAVSIIADYDDAAGNPNNVLTAMNQKTLPDIAAKYNLAVSFGGRNQDQRESVGNLLLGTFIGLGLIYVILAFVFASYSKPLIIMSIIPFGFVGTLLGHYVQGFDLTFLSLIGLLGLSGILVNNSIILIARIEQRRKASEGIRDAIINGVCDRFRAVTLTSLTTVLGLTPLLFETSIQAQFLLPMVITIAWGLGIASIIVLLLVPSLLGVQEDLRRLFAQAQPAAAK